MNKHEKYSVENTEGQLLKYNLARTALAAAHKVDEVKDIRDKAMAMQAYAIQAKDTDLIRYATEIRLRAERRAGELLAEMAERRERQGDGRPSKQSQVATVSKLSDLGVTKTQSSRWQKLAKLDEDEFEGKVEKIIHKTVEIVDGVKSGVRGTTGTGENEWYTPEAYLEAVRAVLGVIDLAPS